jgi:hypothetical protein
VPKRGVEPPRPCGHWHLKPARLPFRHLGAGLILSEAGALDNDLIFWHHESKIMKKLLFFSSFFAIMPIAFLFVLIITLAVYNNALHSPEKTVVYAALPTSQNIFSADITQDDGRKEKIRQFFERYGSPLEPYAGDVVDAADEYGLDYRLIPAIAMQESNLCKKIPEGSNNCWGFGIYGKTVTRFPDYKEAIYTVTKTLATKYKTRGLVTPNEIMTMYTPTSNGSWAYSVNHFMAQLQ